ncbi:hypothetical protein ACHAWC_007234 [Mediolabrus comicus]
MTLALLSVLIILLACVADSSSPLFTRYDQKSYENAASHHSNSTATTDDEKHKWMARLAMKMEILNIEKQKIDENQRRRRWQRKKQQKNKKNEEEGSSSTSSSSSFDNLDDPNKCTTYLAPSSIPNSGLGMYTTVPYHKGDFFPLPEIGILLADKNAHYPAGGNNLLSQYPWGASVLSDGHLDVTDGSSIVPGLGMLANSHLGLVNMRHSDQWKIQCAKDGTASLSLEGLQSTTVNDAGRGSHTLHSRVLFDATKSIAVGEELFVNYGDEWFTFREDWIGVIPSADDYTTAEKKIEDALSKSDNLNDVGDNLSPDVYETLLEEAEKESKRLRAAFPDKVEDIPISFNEQEQRWIWDMSLARFSAPTSIQSIEWIESNGVCIDNIMVGTSTIPQAGQGAYATRTIGKGHVITTTPLITMEREQLQLWEEVDGDDLGIQTEKEDKVKELVGHQLLLNYCYGHVNSSLLLFPYSPSVNFINTAMSIEDANAEIRWSSYPYHKAELLNKSMKEMKEIKKTGLMFDIVATKDIKRGEEVLLYYGKDWEDSWAEHIEEWSSPSARDHTNITDTLAKPTSEDFNERRHPNSVIWTMSEQKIHPYPEHFETVCRFQPAKDVAEKCQENDEDNNVDGYCRVRWTLTLDTLYDHPCNVISRSSIDRSDWYTVRMTIEAKHYHVDYMPQYAIRLINKKYTKDHHARGVFREVIGLPEGLFPDHWMDLKEDDEKYIYQEL